MRVVKALIVLWIALVSLTNAADEAPRVPGAAAGSGPPPAGWIGVYLDGSREGGAAIAGIVEGGPAQRAGLRAGDILKSLDGVAISGPEQLSELLAAAAPGDRVRIGYLRDGESESCLLTVAPRPLRTSHAYVAGAASAYRKAISLSGVSLVPIPEELRVHFHAPSDRGVLVTRVAAGSVAESTGIRVGDVVIRVGETAIRTPADVREALWKNEAPTRIGVVRAGATLELELELDVAPPMPALRFDADAGSASSIRIKLLESELARLEQRMNEIREELERLKGAR